VKGIITEQFDSQNGILLLIQEKLKIMIENEKRWYSRPNKS